MNTDNKKTETELCTIPSVIHCPDELEPVLARIEQINSLGKSGWWEVVYYDGIWRSYSGSKTFENGEKVINWEYCKGCG
jgi:hypothetical protein